MSGTKKLSRIAAALWLGGWGCAAGGATEEPGALSDVGAWMPPGSMGGALAGMGGGAVEPTGTAGTGGVTTTPPLTAGGTGAISDTGGTGGMGGAGAGGIDGTAGTGAMAGMGGTGGVFLAGECCADGDCVCHGPDPSTLTSSNGPYATASYSITAGKVFYPTDAEPPFSAIAIIPGFINSGPEMEPWGPFYASHGFVMVATLTLPTDFPDYRATRLLMAVEELEAENADSASPLYGKLSGRYGTSGYSMGGGGTTIASGQNPMLRSSIGLAAWGPVTNGVSVPTLLLCGASDGTAPCSMSQGAYDTLPAATPKMMISISGATHFSWFTPTAAGQGTSGEYALAFQKVFLDGDERWKPLLLQQPSNGTQRTNIQ